jgi:hypothetical protein
MTRRERIRFCVYTLLRGGRVVRIGKATLRGERTLSAYVRSRYRGRLAYGTVRGRYYASEQAALDAERRAIRRHDPPANRRAGGGGRTSTRARRRQSSGASTRRTQTGRLRATCACGASFHPRWGLTGRPGRSYTRCPRCR